MAKGLNLLALFSKGEEFTHQELLALTGMPKASLSRFTSTLVTMGYLRCDESSRRFSLGAKVLGMTATLQRTMEVQRAAAPLMEALCEHTGVQIGLGTRDRLSVVLLKIVRPTLSVSPVLNADIGTNLPLHTTSMGLTYAVAAPLRERVRLLESLQSRYPGEWPRIRKSIEQAHAELQRYGTVTMKGSLGQEINDIAAPFRAASSGRLYIFNCCAPASQVSAQQLRKVYGPPLIGMLDTLRQHMRNRAAPV